MNVPEPGIDAVPAEEVHRAGVRVDRVVEARAHDDVRSAGLHSVEWDGRDSQGQQVASGVYFTRMNAGDFSEVRKVTVLK